LVQGRADEKDDAKATAARRWVAAVNWWGKLGRWEHAIVGRADQVAPAIAKAIAVREWAVRVR